MLENCCFELLSVNHLFVLLNTILVLIDEFEEYKLSFYQESHHMNNVYLLVLIYPKYHSFVRNQYHMKFE